MPIPPDLVQLLDERVRKDFASLRELFFQWLIFSTIVVFLGVLLEEAERIGHGKVRVNPSTGLPVVRRTRAKVLRNLVSLGWILILAGVIGEGVFEMFVSQADGYLQALNNILLISTQDEMARVNERAAGVENENLRFRLALSGRVLTQEQRNKMHEWLRPYAGVAVDVYALGPDEQSAREEVISFAKDIEGTLEASSLNVRGLFALEGDCQPWPAGVVVSATGVGDLSPERYAAGYILGAIRSPLTITEPIVAPLEMPTCRFFSTLSKPPIRSTPAHIRVVVSRKPPTILK